MEYITAPAGDSGYLSLASGPKGRTYRKQILKRGSLRHPNTGKVIQIDDAFLGSIVANFNNGAVDHVQIPAATDTNEHSDDPERNLGEVVGLDVTEDGLFAHMEFRKDSVLDAPGKTILGASALLSLDYDDNSTGEKIGPTLLHVCATNRPYITGMDGYGELVAASVDTGSNNTRVTFLEAAAMPDLDQIRTSLNSQDVEMRKRALKELGIEDPDDWLALLAPPAPVAPDNDELKEALITAKEAGVAEANKQVVAALSDVLQLTDAAVAAEEDPVALTTAVAAKVDELVQSNVALTARLDAAERASAESEVDGLVAAGRVLPKQRDAFIELALTNRAQFDALVPDESIVPLTAVGVDAIEVPGGASLSEADAAKTADALLEQYGLKNTRGA